MLSHFLLKSYYTARFLFTGPISHNRAIENDRLPDRCSQLERALREADSMNDLSRVTSDLNDLAQSILRRVGLRCRAELEASRCHMNSFIRGLNGSQIEPPQFERAREAIQRTIAALRECA